MSDRVAHVERLVAGLAPRDERERSARARTLLELTRLHAPLDEHAHTTHVTASAVVVSARGLLLHRHKRLGMWMQPGGHVEPDEWPCETAVRETAEETGLTGRHTDRAHLLHLDVHAGGRGHVHLDLRWLLLAPPVDPAPPTGESQQVAWFGLDAARRVADAGLAGVLDHPRLLAGLARAVDEEAVGG